MFPHFSRKCNHLYASIYVLIRTIFCVVMASANQTCPPSKIGARRAYHALSPFLPNMGLDPGCGCAPSGGAACFGADVGSLAGRRRPAPASRPRGRGVASAARAVQWSGAMGLPGDALRPPGRRWHDRSALCPPNPRRRGRDVPRPWRGPRDGGCSPPCAPLVAHPGGGAAIGGGRGTIVTGLDRRRRRGRWRERHPGIPRTRLGLCGTPERRCAAKERPTAGCRLRPDRSPRKSPRCC